ncbi:carbohydrate kinase family protein [Ruania zhangjianzhongii]|uniref:carbohydrate kinase family protein n=1 Tax=Ruania zhangjianzhongii TaxID=2603206 RepID=UPI0011CC10FF|nr:carbohydrate kinase family protein [Ruania zhangjianzhongii]
MSTPSTSPDLVVVGDASIDHYVQVPHLATSDNKAIGRYLGAFGGGMSANLAAAAATQGARTRLVTKVGTDREGPSELQALSDLGVDVTYSVQDATHRTWMCFVQLDSTGEKALIGADTGIKIPQRDEIDPSALHGARIVAPLADDLDWAARIAQSAVDGGAQVAIDLEPDAFGPDDPQLHQLLSLTEYVFLNTASAQKFHPHSHARAAAALHELGPGTVVVGRGEQGAYCSLADGSTVTAHAPAGVPVVDTTGAGDALAGSFLAGVLQGRSPEACLRTAVANATACITRVGSRTYLTEPAPAPSTTEPLTIERTLR